MRKFQQSVDRGIQVALNSALWSFILMTVLWIWRGRSNKKRKLLSGIKVVSSKTLRKIVKKSGPGASIILGKIKLPKNAETKHLFICGTTGAGKTNCIHELLPQVRSLNQKAVIIDLTGDLVATYYKEGRDVILNPFDSRSRGWSPWAECKQNYHYDDLATFLIPPSTQEAFWHSSARTLLSESLKKITPQEGLKTLLNYLLNVPLKEIEDLLNQTSAAPLLARDNDKTAASIRATLGNAIKSLEHVDGSHDVFSIRRWVQDPDNNDGWLFLSCTPEQRETLKPLISGWASVAISSLMSLTASPTRRMWVVIDELHALSCLPLLPQALAEARKYGGCFVLGTQDFNQLDAIYGANNTRSMMGLLNTKILFRSPDDYTAKRLSAILGEQESSEIIEGLSYGAHHMRDGVSLSDQRRTRPAVSPSEIMTLDDLAAYIKLPGNFPIAKIHFTYQNRPQISEGFVPKPSLEKKGLFEEKLAENGPPLSA